MAADKAARLVRLPRGWEEHTDLASGRLFYNNATTNESVWSLEEAVAEAAEKAKLEAESSKPVRVANVAAWAGRFPNARALAVIPGRMTPALAVSITKAAGAMPGLETLSLRECCIGVEGGNERRKLAEARQAGLEQ